MWSVRGSKVEDASHGPDVAPASAAASPALLAAAAGADGPAKDGGAKSRPFFLHGGEREEPSS